MVQCMNPALEDHLTWKTPKTHKVLFLLEWDHLISVHFVSALEDADEGPEMET